MPCLKDDAGFCLPPSQWLAIFCFGVGSPVAEVAKQSLVRSRARAVPPFVFTRRGSMFYDEDGDLAHEFYEETIITKNGQKRSNLRRLYHEVGHCDNNACLLLNEFSLKFFFPCFYFNVVPM
uniref:Tumor suppressor 2, mitochondrial calcium regulator like 1 n=1 Tax=Rattus norvegicus TaxID=10116 RepID=A0A8I5ZMV1_RAT